MCVCVCFFILKDSLDKERWQGHNYKGVEYCETTTVQY